MILKLGRYGNQRSADYLSFTILLSTLEFNIFE
jgi:hypothetical protein